MTYKEVVLTMTIDAQADKSAIDDAIAKVNAITAVARFENTVADYRREVRRRVGWDKTVYVLAAWPKPGHVTVYVPDATEHDVDALQRKFDPDGDGSGLGLAPIGCVVHVDRWSGF